MSARILLPRALSDYASGAASVDVTCAAGAPLGDVLSALSRSYPAVGRRILDETGEIRRYVNVFVNGEECRPLGGLTTRVPEDAEIHIIGSIAGG